jgi:hypothetical protein
MNFEYDMKNRRTNFANSWITAIDARTFWEAERLARQKWRQLRRS